MSGEMFKPIVINSASSDDQKVNGVAKNAAMGGVTASVVALGVAHEIFNANEALAHHGKSHEADCDGVVGVFEAFPWDQTNDITITAGRSAELVSTEENSVIDSFEGHEGTVSADWEELGINTAEGGIVYYRFDWVAHGTRGNYGDPHEFDATNCKPVETTTSTTKPEETTTTTEQSTTTTSEVTTTTSTPEETTTTGPSTTMTLTSMSRPETTLPRTGGESGPLVDLGLGLALAGAALAMVSKRGKSRA